MAYVYRHIRLDKNEPFYVGIGSDIDYKRAYSKSGRTHFWLAVSKKGYEVEILLEDLTWEQACEKEKEFIRLYGRKDLNTGCLVNMTDGGDGSLGRPMTDRLKTVLKASPHRYSLYEWQKKNGGAANKGKKFGPKNRDIVEKAIKTHKKRWSENKEKLLLNNKFIKNNPNYLLIHCDSCGKDIRGAGPFKRFHGNACKTNLIET